ncbi:hypothetical protein FYK55_15600 [Roseiconus nitratireducens]|uniref:Uncharacterized protein n=1 Tax=Roseiconus nitratireducens TaxID=2605748 RepID=A0A5M6D650_9BACT|nr:hypothetical protein [Roseiconus nitratireducens]KAA5542226.1 hypothetical protein FYK55_15600 [Roseiconus nitratireducens]
MPQISLRWLIALVTVSSLAMAVIHQAVTGDHMGAAIATVVIAATLVPVVMYAATFLLAGLFALIGSAASRPETPQPIHVPTSRMPDQNQT